MFTRYSVIISRNIKTPLTSISRAVGNILQLTLGQLIKSLFANSEQGFWYDPNDLSTMFQDAAGTIPVTAVGQPVGLLLDKNKGLELGVEKVVNGSFDTDTAWVKNTGVTISSGIVNISTAASAYAVSQVTPVPANKIYKVTYTINSYSSGGLRCVVGGAAGVTRNSAGTFTEYVRSFGSSAVQLASASGFVGSVDNLSVKEVLGNHAYQTTSSMRPVLRQVPILGSELIVNGDFSAGLANWIPNGAAVLLVTSGVLSITAQGSTSGVYQDFTTEIGKTYRVSSLRTGGLLMVLYANHGFSPPITLVNNTFVATSNKVRIFTYCNGINTGTVSSITVKELQDYYTSKTYLDYDSVDDKLTTTLPTPLTNATIIRSVPNIGTQILTGQTIPTPYNDSTDNCGLIVINRALTPSETSQITKLFNKAAGV